MNRVFEALAHPTRRAILEILKSMQRVTGDTRYRPSLWLQRRVQLGMSLLKSTAE